MKYINESQKNKYAYINNRIGNSYFWLIRSINNNNGGASETPLENMDFITLNLFGIIKVKFKFSSYITLYGNYVFF
ncbi:hypothetical protein [Spiroplasma endosymbiont of Atherix ibis]|uniref:hypothetical protein n=1 Tax=Spiroplasma endosymbiont of Atherix ibis TaxID=3066291 RepID=UPI0030D202CA